jgi:uncharacterized protein (DUF305 family)
MNITIHSAIRHLALTGALAASLIGAVAYSQTPEVAGCETTGTPAGDMSGMGHGAMHESTPMTGMGHGAMHESTPMEGMHHQAEFDLMYIDMMIPHHESIIALGQVALPELTDPRLIEIAEAVVETQTAEIDALTELRQEWYGDAEPVSMNMMMEGMPGMGTDMAMMEQQMSAELQVQSFCAAEDKDLAFIEQVIPHHQMAIDASEMALEQAVHPELKEIAQDVIDAQQQEIDTLEAIRAELMGEATPAS